MKTHSASNQAFKSLLTSRSHEWKRETLELCTDKQLYALCAFGGFPTSGNKTEKVDRLLDLAQVLRIVKAFDPDSSIENPVSQIQNFAHTYPGKELKGLCKRAGIFSPSTKYGMAASLINWRRGCIDRGQQAYTKAYVEAVVQKARQPKQLSLF